MPTLPAPPQIDSKTKFRLLKDSSIIKEYLSTIVDLQQGATVTIDGAEFVIEKKVYKLDEFNGHVIGIEYYL